MTIFSAFKTAFPETFPLLTKTQLKELQKTWERDILRLNRLKRLGLGTMTIQEKDRLEALLKLKTIALTIESKIDEEPQNLYHLVLNIPDLNFSNESYDIQLVIIRELLIMDPSMDIKACLDKIYPNALLSNESDMDIHAMKCCTLVQCLEIEENQELQQKIIALLEMDYVGHPIFGGESLPDFALLHGHQVLAQHYFPQTMSPQEVLIKLHEMNVYLIQKYNQSLLQFVLDKPKALTLLFHLYPEGQFYQAIQEKNAEGEHALHRAASTNLSQLQTLMSLLSVDRLKIILSEKTRQGRDVMHHAKDHPLAVCAILMRLPIDYRHHVLSSDELIKHLMMHHCDHIKDILGALDQNMAIAVVMEQRWQNQENLLHIAAREAPTGLLNILLTLHPSLHSDAMMCCNQDGDTVWHILVHYNPQYFCTVLQPISPGYSVEMLTRRNNLGQCVIHLAHQDSGALDVIFKRYPSDNHRLDVLKDEDLTGNTVLSYMNQQGLVNFGVISACFPGYLSLKAIRLLLQMSDLTPGSITVLKNTMIEHIERMSDPSRTSEFCFFKFSEQTMGLSSKKMALLHKIKDQISEAQDVVALRKAIHDLDPFIKIPDAERSRLQPNALKRIMEHNKFKLA